MTFATEKRFRLLVSCLVANGHGMVTTQPLRTPWHPHAAMATECPALLDQYWLLWSVPGILRECGAHRLLVAGHNKDFVLARCCVWSESSSLGGKESAAGLECPSVSHSHVLFPVATAHHSATSRLCHTRSRPRPAATYVFQNVLCPNHTPAWARHVRLLLFATDQLVSYARQPACRSALWVDIVICYPNPFLAGRCDVYPGKELVRYHDVGVGVLPLWLGHCIRR